MHFSCGEKQTPETHASHNTHFVVDPLCKNSQLHMSHNRLSTHPSTYVERERKAHTMSRLQAHQQTHNKGWRFATESPWTLWHTGGFRQGHPRYTSAPAEEGCGWPDTSSTRRPTTNDNTTDKVLRQTCFQRNQVLTHLETYMVAEPVRETRDLRRIVKLRQQGRSGEVPNQEDRAEKRRISTH